MLCHIGLFGNPGIVVVVEFLTADTAEVLTELDADFFMEPAEKSFNCEGALIVGGGVETGKVTDWEPSSTQVV